DLFDHGFQAQLVDGAHALGRDPQGHEALLALQPETVRVQVRQPTAPRLVVGVRDVVPGGGRLARDLADSRHGSDPLRDRPPRDRGGRKGGYFSSRPPFGKHFRGLYKAGQRQERPKSSPSPRKTPPPRPPPRSGPAPGCPPGRGRPAAAG